MNPQWFKTTPKPLWFWKFLQKYFLNLILPIFHSACEGHGYALLIHENMLLIFFLCPRDNPSFLLRKVSVKEMQEARGLLRWTETTGNRHPDFDTSLVTKSCWNSAQPSPKQYIKSIRCICMPRKAPLFKAFLWLFLEFWWDLRFLTKIIEVVVLHEFFRYGNDFVIKLKLRKNIFKFKSF